MGIEAAAFAHPWSMADFDFLVADPRAINLALRYGDELAGYAMSLVEDGDLHVVNLAVDEVYRGRGWGTRLVEELLRRAAMKGCGACRLEVRRSNTAAQALYSRCGFRPVGVARSYYTGPSEDALILARTVEPVAGDADRSVPRP